jgi:hypothetical protein
MELEGAGAVQIRGVDDAMEHPSSELSEPRGSACLELPQPHFSGISDARCSSAPQTASSDTD